MAAGFALAIFAVAFAIALPAAPARAAECANEQVRRESSVNPATGEPYDLALPGCRAYEMVSPVDKAGHNVALGVPMQSPVAPDGSAVVYVSQGAFGEAEGSSAVFQDNNYRGLRGAEGWTSRAEFMPASLSPSPWGLSLERALLFTPDLSRMAVCGAPGEGQVPSAAGPRSPCARTPSSCPRDWSPLLQLSRRCPRKPRVTLAWIASKSESNLDASPPAPLSSNTPARLTWGTPDGAGLARGFGLGESGSACRSEGSSSMITSYIR